MSNFSNTVRNSINILHRAYFDPAFYTQVSEHINTLYVPYKKTKAGDMLYKAAHNEVTDLSIQEWHHAADIMFGALRHHNSNLETIEPIKPTVQLVREQVYSWFLNMNNLLNGCAELPFGIYDGWNFGGTLPPGSEPKYDGHQSFDTLVDKAMENVPAVLEAMSKFSEDDSVTITSTWKKDLREKRHSDIAYKLYTSPSFKGLHTIDIDMSEWLADVDARLGGSKEDIPVSDMFMTELEPEVKFDVVKLNQNIYPALTKINGTFGTGNPGLIKGEMILAGIPSGGGKTTLCTQLLVDAAMSGEFCLYVSTEMNKHNIQARALSYASLRLAGREAYAKGLFGMAKLSREGCPSFPQAMIDKMEYEPIPYYLLRNGGLNADRWAEDKLKNERATGTYDRTHRMNNARKAAFEQVIKDRIMFVSISDIGGVDNLGYTVGRINKYLQEKFGPEAHVGLVTLDWLGGALVEGSINGNSEVRHIFYTTATSLASLAEKHNFAAVATMQLNDEATDKPYPSISTFAECKGVKDNATVVFTVSAVKHETHKKRLGKDAPEPEMDSISGFARQQGINCGKARNGDASSHEVYRDFDYQYFYKF